MDLEEGGRESSSARSHRLAQAGVLAVLRSGPAVSRAELERALGLSRSAVVKAVDHLLAMGVIGEEPGQSDGGRGRPGRRLVARYPGGTVVGIDFGHDHIAVAIADLDLTVRAEDRTPFPVDDDANAAMGAAAELVADLIDGAGLAAAEQPTICGVGVPGPLDAARRMVSSPTILRNWSGVDLVEELGLRTGLSVVIDNDANLGAIAELHAGAAVSYQNFIYVKASGGVGACVVINGQVLRGHAGAAGEIGHTQLRADGAWCRCGNRGCLETVVSVGQVLEQIGNLYPGVPDLRENLPELAAHPVARKVLAESGRTLGMVLANLCALLDPAALVIGGELVLAGPEFIAGLDESVQRLAQPGRDNQVHVHPAALGIRAELMGSLLIARDAQLATTTG
ncbi:ROK family transcriptional regulator [Nakamurella lactea]|uniref:ROK family transcriptional regulator n=1 Tax=Nakamurella lactea TaxID=459515 RepID=UPI0004215E76|nr:ROK family transcriptional regulator [Nakamurella lactea]